MIFKILLLLFLTSHVTTFKVNVTQSHYDVKENHNVTLEWTFTTNSSFSQTETFVSCDFITDKESLVLYRILNGKEIPHSHDRHFLRRVRSDTDLREGRIRLNVSRLKTNDSGLYVCDVDTNYGRGSAVIHLNVTQALPPLVVNVTQRNYQAEENHDVTLEWTFTTNTETKLEEIYIYCEQLTKEKSSVLYVVHAGVENPDSVDERFSGRVQSESHLREGRIRHNLSRLKTEDSGQYVCDVDTLSSFGSNYSELNITASAQRPTERPIPSPQPEPRRWRGLTTGLLVAVVVVCVVFIKIKRHTNSRDIRTSRTPLCERGTEQI